jgi:hypothetical protein
LIRLIGTQTRDPPSHLLPFNRPDLLSATHPSDHNAVHFQSRNPAAHRLATLMYANLARQKEREARKAAEKAVKKASKAKANGTALKRSVSLPTLLPPHAPRLQPPGKTLSTTRSPMYAYETAFLVPVPLFFGAGLGLGLGAGLLGCVAAGGYLIDPAGSCGGGGFNGGAGCGGTAGGAACANGGAACASEH